MPLSMSVSRAAEAPLHAVAQHVARRQERERRADARCERDDHGARDETEDRTGGQRHDRGARQRQRGHRDVHDEEHRRHRQRPVVVQRGEIALLRLDVLEAQEAPEIEHEIRRDQRDDECGDDELLLRHASSLFSPDAPGVSIRRAARPRGAGCRARAQASATPRSRTARPPRQAPGQGCGHRAAHP